MQAEASSSYGSFRFIYFSPSNKRFAFKEPRMAWRTLTKRKA